MDKINRNYKIGFLLIVISIFMIIGGGISSLFIGLKEDRNETMFRMSDVKTEYEEYSTFVSLFEVERDSLYEKILSNVTYDYLYSNDVDIKNKLSNYETMVDEIYTKSNKLDGLCNDMYYPDSNANSICNNYKTIYEQVNNYFIIDINTYNTNIKKFNESIVLENPLLVLKEYETDKKMIDFDEDGVIVGSE